MTDSRTKGAAFERVIANDLRTWLGEDWTVQRLRTDAQRDQYGAGFAGEFAIRGPLRFPFAIECKASKVWTWKQVMGADGVVGPTVRWWAQATRQAMSVGLRPLLVVKPMRIPAVAILKREDALRMALPVFGEVPSAAFRLAGHRAVAIHWREFLTGGPFSVLEVADDAGR